MPASGSGNEGGTGEGFTVIESTVVHEGAVVRTEILDIRTPEGDIVQRQVVRHPGAVAVVAVHEGHVILVSQYRAALDDYLIEIPAGKRDIDGEDPAEAARRELIEEVGLECDSLELLGPFITAAGFCDEELIIYATASCRQVERQVDGVEEEHSEILRVPVGEIDAWLTDGRLIDAKTIIGLYWARDRGLFA